MMTLKVNGRDHQVDADPDTPLLYVLREELKLNAAKFGCGLGQCGSCTVMVDGKTHFPMTPSDFTKGMMRFINEFGVNIVGGCCGTTPEHLRAIVLRRE